MQVPPGRPSRRFPCFVVNAFICEDGVSSGNPAAVVLIPPDYADLSVSDEWMQNIAAVMNLSETTFVRWNNDSDGYEIRWFTPKAEVDLCGHATVAAATSLQWYGAVTGAQPLRFRAKKSGRELKVGVTGDQVSLFFPADPPTLVPDCDYPELAISVKRALGTKESMKLLRGKYDLVVQLGTPEAVRDLEVDFSFLKNNVATDRGVAVCAAGEEDDAVFLGRFFAPKVGIDEDPVTGSMMCTLAPLFLDEGNKDLKKVRQLSQRGGALQVRMVDDKKTVEIRGRAKIIVTGHMEYE